MSNPSKRQAQDQNQILPKGDRELPAPDWRRCDAIAKPAESPSLNGPWNARAHRCGNYATRQRDGYQVCVQHFRLANVRFSPDAHRLRRIYEYAAMMAVALGDEEAAQ